MLCAHFIDECDSSDFNQSDTWDVIASHTRSFTSANIIELTQVNPDPRSFALPSFPNRNRNTETSSTFNK